MTKLQLLNSYLTERLGEVVREILDVVEDTVSEYLEETARTRRENDSLRRQLRDAVLLAKTDLFGPVPADEVSAVRHVEWTPTAHQDPRISPAPPGGGLRLRVEGSEVTAKEEPMEEPLRCAESESLPGRVQGDALTSDPQIKAEPEEADITVTITTDMLSMTPDSAAHTHTLTHANANGGPAAHTQHTHRITHPSLQPPRTHTHTHTHTEAGAPGGSRRVDGQVSVRSRAERVCVRVAASQAQQCGVCGEVCVGHGALEQHQRTASHRRPFGCECCGRRFTQSADLRRHMRTHTGERPHQCHVCHKSFSQIGNLRRHQRTHTRTHT
ncbi:uncharacterized protein LOC143138354 [Alosa pseudoharengus]|uniref:uncharacterized protein LOC143138354 n=1 Tax=Alosa pseudoharengus TaxID=34774 RepID=UPI003F8A8AB5